MKPARTVISTVGTSLLEGNLARIADDDPDPSRRALASAYSARDWGGVAEGLARVAASDRTCGAEINSLACLLDGGYADPMANLFFCHSATEAGRDTGRALAAYYRLGGHPVVESIEIEGLSDEDPVRFRTVGLRNLAKAVCHVVRERDASSCAINATGGYKAQIAIAVLMGQALGVPVYFKHERFRDEIIAFPPMPVALDFQVWMRVGGLLSVLERDGHAPASLLDDYAPDVESLESLIERVTIDGEEFLDLSATGQIFHETFRQRFAALAPGVLPPPAAPGQKRPPRLEDSGHLLGHAEIRRHLEAVTAEVPQVVQCSTFYFNPDLPSRPRFRLGPQGVEGIASNGSWTVKFRVATTAQSDSQSAAMLAALSEWLDARV